MQKYISHGRESGLKNIPLDCGELVRGGCWKNVQLGCEMLEDISLGQEVVIEVYPTWLQGGYVDECNGRTNEETSRFMI